MDISLYDFIVLFIIVPFLLFRFTDIPRWLFSRARKISPKRLLLAAALLGAAIGYEREFRGKGAGVRTHMLVAMGACLFMMISKYGMFIPSCFLIIVLRPALWFRSHTAPPGGPPLRRPVSP